MSDATVRQVTAFGAGRALWWAALVYASFVLLTALVVPVDDASPLDGGLETEWSRSRVQVEGLVAFVEAAAPLAAVVAVGGALRAGRRWSLAIAWTAWTGLALGALLTLSTGGLGVAPLAALLVPLLVRAGQVQDPDRAPRERAAR